MLWSMALSGKTTQLIQKKYSTFVKVGCDRSIRLHHECRTVHQPTHSHEAKAVSLERDSHRVSRVYLTTENASDKLLQSRNIVCGKIPQRRQRNLE